MKRTLFLLCLFPYFIYTSAQENITITLLTPDPVDQVYITGDQEALGDWDPAAVPMKKVSEEE
ncbi:MAG: hypothetical protein LUF04_03880 [Bacteroides sp.]|nr:hypothetical protein [Bacteroides sp.]